MKALLFGSALLLGAAMLWRYSRPIAGIVARGPRFRPLTDEQLDSASRGFRFFAGMLFVMFLAWLFVWVRSYFGE